MTDRRDESRCRTGTDGSLLSRRVTRRVLLLGGYVVAGWMGLCAFGGHHAEAAVAPAAAGTHAAVHPQTASAHAGLLDAVTASVTSGPQAAGAAPSNGASALPHLADLAPVRTVLDGAVSTGAPVPHGADPKPSIVDRVGSVADLPDAVQIGKPVEDTLAAVTAPVHQIHHVVAPVTRTLPSGPGTIVDTVTDHVNDIVAGSDPASDPAPAPVTAPAPAPHSTAPGSADRPQAAQHPTGTAARHSQHGSSERVSAAPVPALDPAIHPATNANRSDGLRALPAGAHPQDAAQTPRGSLRSGAGAPTAPPQNPQTPPNPGPIPVLPGNAAVAGASVTTSQLGSGFSGSALLADQMMTAAQFRAVHTGQHDNARIARAEAAAPSCSPD